MNTLLRLYTAIISHSSPSRKKKKGFGIQNCSGLLSFLQLFRVLGRDCGMWNLGAKKEKEKRKEGEWIAPHFAL